MLLSGLSVRPITDISIYTLSLGSVKRLPCRYHENIYAFIAPPQFLINALVVTSTVSDSLCLRSGGFSGFLIELFGAWRG